jgi:hypothetical protein
VKKVSCMRKYQFRAPNDSLLEDMVRFSRYEHGVSLLLTVLLLFVVVNSFSTASL